MSKVVAFVLLACAAFAVPLPWLDRSGVALLGLAFAVLALPAALPRLHPSGKPKVAKGTQLPPVAWPDDTSDLLDRLAAYGGQGD